MTLLEEANWKEYIEVDSIIKEDFDQKNRIKSKGIIIRPDFFGGEIGVGEDKVNSLTISRMAKSFLADFRKRHPKRVGDFVVAFDSRASSLHLAKFVIAALQTEGAGVVKFEDWSSQPLPLVSYIVNSRKMDGAIYITGDALSSKSNGLKFLNSDGTLCFNVEEIHKNAKKMDLFVHYNDIENAPSIESIEIDNYINKVLAKRALDIPVDVSISLSNLGGEMFNSSKKVFENGQLFSDATFATNVFAEKKPKTMNVSNGKSLLTTEKLARKNKSQAMVTVSSDGTEISVAVKYKRRYKYLKNSELISVYLDYKLGQLKSENKLKKNSYIIKTSLAPTLPQKIADKYDVEVIELENNLSSIAEIIAERKGDFLFAYDEVGGFITDYNDAKVKNSLLAVINVMEMENSFRVTNQSTYTKLKDLYVEYGIHRTSIEHIEASPKNKKRIEKALLSKKTIDGIKVAKKDVFKKSIKVTLANGTWVGLGQSNDNSKISLFKEIVGEKEQKTIDIVTTDKVIDVIVDDACEEFKDRKFTFKGFLKYMLFISIVIGVFVFVFLKIYKGSAGGSYYGAAKDIASLELKSIWLTVWIWQGFILFLDAWMKKRMFMIQGVKVKTRHLIISSLMGWIISFVTPLAVGGDAIGYWYLRRKGVQRGPLLATLSTSTMLGEIKYTFQTVFLVAIGWNVYKHVFETGGIQSKAALIWFFIGMGWSVFATTMILLLTVSRRVQEFILKNSIRFLEWFRFTKIYDPGHVMAKYQYEFKTMRDGARRIWSKWYMPIELAVYSLLPLFISPLAMIYASNGLIANTGTSPYWSQIVANDIVGTANSMSITPGGTGTQEWLNVQIYNTLFSGAHFEAMHNYNPSTIASGKDVFEKIFLTWPFLVFSAILTVTTVFLESARKRYKEKIILIKGAISFIWIMAVAVYLVLFFFVLL